MRLTATEFRKNLFSSLEKALHGEAVEVVYRGATIKLTPQTSPKLARAKRQHALLCDPDSIIGPDPTLLAEWEASWNKDWTRS